MSHAPELERIAERALDLVPEDSVVGLGTGRAAAAFVDVLGARVRDGFRVRGVPTSEATAAQARGLGIPLVELGEVELIDVTVDGADEVDPDLNLIKGYGGALLREKVVAAASRREVILVGEEKLVARLGERGRLPVEVLPFATALCRRRLADLGLAATLRRQGDGGVFLTDSGNYILDAVVSPIEDAMALEWALRSIPGVIGTGLFLRLAERVLVASGDQVRELIRRT